jgi:hypothetical protein
MTQAEKFEQAVNQHKEEQAERENRKGGFTRIIYAPLEKGKNRAFRFTGLPVNVRERPTDCKRIFEASIVGDDGKKMFLTGPDPEVNKSYLLYRIINKVLSYQWNPDLVNQKTGKKGVRVYNYINSHPAIFNMVLKNGNPANEMEQGWQFRPVILANVIDRADMAWHRENKKLKVLSKKVSETSGGALWYEHGFPEGLYSLILEDIVAAFGDWEGYDIVIKKLDTKVQPFYKAFHAINDAARFSDDAALLSLIHEEAMTDEERSWEGWNFDELYGVSPYIKIQKNLGDSIRRIDKELKTNFYDELLDFVSKEEDEKSKKSGATSAGSSTDSDPESEPEEENVPEAAEQPKQPAATAVDSGARVRQASGTTATANSFNVNEILKDAQRFKGANLLTAEERRWITGIDEKGYLTWSIAAGELVRDADNKDQLIPEKVHCNPYTGRLYDAA